MNIKSIRNAIISQYVSLCASFTNSPIKSYFIWIVVSGNFYGHSCSFERHVQISSSGSANAHLPGCFCPWTPYFHRWYSTGEFQALQLIVIAVFGAVELTLASCIMVHFLEVKFEMENDIFIVLIMFYTHTHIYIYSNASQYDKTSFSFHLFSYFK